MHNVRSEVRHFVVFISAVLIALLGDTVFAAESVPTLSFGEPSQSSSGEITIPVLLDTSGATDVSAWAISVRGEERVLAGVTIQRASNAPVVPAFETTARGQNNVTYIAWTQQSAPSGAMHVADVHVSADVARADVRLELDRELTTVSDAGGTHARSAANGGLHMDKGRVDVRQGRHRAAAR